MKMNSIGYVISCNNQNTGVGGHYHSLKATAELMSQRYKVTIFIVGSKACPTLENGKFNCIRIPFGLNIFNSFKALKKGVQKEACDVLHSFDIKADFYARVCANTLKLPLINTKCGGASPNKYYPLHSTLILYSKEDQEYFCQHKKFNSSVIEIIPNRVYEGKVDYERITDIKNQIEVTDNIILRISRIVGYYKNSLKQTINLHKNLLASGIKTTLVIIGIPEDEKVLEELKKESEQLPRVYFFTDSKYTKNANELVELADIVVGTGRGFMEASSKSKILMAPIKDALLPAFVTSENFQFLFKTNFSERNNIPNFNKDENFNQLASLLNNPTTKVEYNEFSKQIFDKYFNLFTQFNKYEEIYQNQKYSKEHFFDLLLHCTFVLRFLLFKN